MNKNNLKALLEKRNSLVEEMSNIVETAETEERALEDAQISRLDEIKLDVNALDETIKRAKEVRSMTGKQENKGDLDLDKEKDLVGQDNTEKEVRGFEQFLRGRYGEERRALEEASTTTLANSTEGTPGNGGVTVPTVVYDTIIEKLSEASPIFEAVRKFTSVTGNLKIAREDTLHDEGFIGETLDATKIRPTLKTVTLNQKRVGAATQLTNQLINDSGIDIVGYTNGLLSRSVMRAIERGILLGAKTGEEADQTFRPVIGDADVENVEFEGEGPGVEDILTLYSSLNPGYLDGSLFIMSRRVFNHILKLKDGDGTYLVFRDIVNGKPGYTLFGVPIYVTSILEDAPEGKEIVFGNFQQAYGLLIKKNMNMIVVTADTTQALAGGRLAVLDAYMDGAVFNPDAVKTASITTTP